MMTALYAIAWLVVGFLVITAVNLQAGNVNSEVDVDRDRWAMVGAMLLWPGTIVAVIAWHIPNLSVRIANKVRNWWRSA